MFRALFLSFGMLFLFSGTAIAAYYWYPSQYEKATLAYEDMWPWQGDYDQNDFVVWYRMFGKGPDNPSLGEELGELRLYLYPHARGSSIDSGFAVLMPEECLAGATVTVRLGCYGEEGNLLSSDPVSGAYVLINNIREVLPGDGFTNTLTSVPAVASQEMVFRFVFSSPVNGACVFEKFNPFLFRVDNPGQETHLPGYPPSDNADILLFGEGNDATIPFIGPFYITQQGLPYALDIPVAWNHPGEKVPITVAYPDFTTWVQSEGLHNRSWWVLNDLDDFLFPGAEEGLTWNKEQVVLPDANCNTGMVTVPAGPFMQGCNASVDSRCDSYEYPYHEVNPPAFAIDIYEITVSAYAECVATGDCSEPYSTEHTHNWGKLERINHPVNAINWYQAREYCTWAGKRLCSESEWEKADRGTDERIYPWGNENATCEYAVMYENGLGCGDGITWSVGYKVLGMSFYGAYDMAGNVYEWVEDDWHSDYNGAPTDGSAWVDNPRGTYRMICGGRFDDAAGRLRASARGGEFPDRYAYYYYIFGSRCCRSL